MTAIDTQRSHLPATESPTFGALAALLIGIAMLVTQQFFAHDADVLRRIDAQLDLATANMKNRDFDLFGDTDFLTDFAR